MNPHLSSSGRKFHESRKGGEAGTEREEQPFLAGLRPAAVQDLPQDKQNGGRRHVAVVLEDAVGKTQGLLELPVEGLARYFLAVCVRLILPCIVRTAIAPP